MRRVLPLLCLCLYLLLPARPALAAPSERLADVLQDQRTQGYRSVSHALARLRLAADVPGASSPLDQRERYQRALLELAQLGHQSEQAHASMAALEQMADSEGCVPCRFDVLLAKTRDTLREQTAAAARVPLAGAEALLPQVHQADAPERLLAVQMVVEEYDGKFNRAIELAVRASELAGRQGDTAEQLRLLAAMIGMNADLGDPRRAVELGQEAYARAAALNYRTLMGVISLDLGHAYALLNERPQQRAALERALALSAFSADDPDLLGIQQMSLNNLADYYLSQPGQAAQVLNYARRADALAQAHLQPIERAAPLANIGIALAQSGNTAGGVNTLHQAIDISRRYGDTTYVIGITQELVKVLEKAGRYREALIELHQADAAQADLTRQQREKAVLELQEKYAGERKSQQIAQLSAQNKLKQAQLAAEAWRNRLWIALAAILALGTMLLLQSIRRARQANRQLAVANAALAEQSMVDPLTGAFNRRHTQALLERLQQGLARRRAHESEAPVGTGLLLLDLDFFKRINDTWGHAAGDAVLVAVAQRLRTLLRQDDVVARWGGEEFVLVLPNTSAQALPTLARHVLHVIGEAPVLVGELPLAVSVSLGAVSFPAMPGQDWEDALGLADLALYQAKAGGRNRAVCLTRVASLADPARVSLDLAQAQAAGDVELTVVTGPARELPPPQRDVSALPLERERAVPAH